MRPADSSIHWKEPITFSGWDWYQQSCWQLTYNIFPMSIRSQKVAEILRNDHSDLRLLESYIETLENLNSRLINENTIIWHELGELRDQNQTLRLERAQFQRNLESSKEMLNSIQMLFQQMTGHGSGVQSIGLADGQAAPPQKLQAFEESSQTSSN